MTKEFSGIEAEDVQSTVMSLDGVKVGYAVIEPEEIKKVLAALALTPPFGHNVEEIKVTFVLAAGV